MVFGTVQDKGCLLVHTCPAIVDTFSARPNEKVSNEQWPGGALFLEKGWKKYKLKKYKPQRAWLLFITACIFYYDSKR